LQRSLQNGRQARSTGRRRQYTQTGSGRVKPAYSIADSLMADLLIDFGVEVGDRRGFGDFAVGAAADGRRYRQSPITEFSSI
jgi:hypothetical protein